MALDGLTAALGDLIDRRTRTKALATSGGHYATFAAAIADVATWATLLVAPGTHAYLQETVPANKKIVGIGPAGSCILQTTLNVADSTALTLMDGAVLENITLASAAVGANTIRLVVTDAGTFAKAILHRVRMIQGAGGQKYTFRLRCVMSDCEINFDASGGNLYFWRDSFVTNTRFVNAYAGGAGNLVILPEDVVAGTPIILSGCHFETTNGVDSWISLSAAGAWVQVVGCTFDGGLDAVRVGANIAEVDVVGCDLGGLLITSNVAHTGYLREKGNTRRGGYSGTWGAMTFEVDPGIVVRVTAAAYTARGYESRIEVDRNGGGLCTITLSDIDLHGTPALEIVSTDDAATPSNVQVDRAGANTIRDATDTSYLIDTTVDRRGGVVLGCDTANNVWTLLSATARAIDFFSMDVAIVGNNTHYIRFWAHERIEIVGIQTRYSTVATVGTYTVSVKGAGNELILAASAPYDLTTLVADTITDIPLTATLANRILAKRALVEMAWVSNNPGLDAAGGYIEITYRKLGG